MPFNTLRNIILDLDLQLLLGIGICWTNYGYHFLLVCSVWGISKEQIVS